MDTFLAIASIRAVRKYTAAPLADDLLRRLLEAGRATGSSRNEQGWRFYVARKREVLDQLAETLSSPENLHGAQAAIAVVMTTPRTFDGGRAAQNIMLAAWAEGIGSCPNRARKQDAAKRILDLEDDYEISTILSLGYPAEPLRPKSSDPEEILRRIDRKPLDELTHWID
jgi:nitroreductase